MKTRVIILILFLGSVTFGHQVIGLLPDPDERPATAEASRWIEDALAHADADVMVFGDRLAQCQVNPFVLQQQAGGTAYNAGCSGQDVYCTRMLESLLLRRGCSSRLFIYLVNWRDLYRDDLGQAQTFSAYAAEDPLINEILSGHSTSQRAQPAPRPDRDRAARPIWSTPAVASLRLISHEARHRPANAHPERATDREPAPADPWDLALMVKKLRLYADLVHAARANSTEVWFVVGPSQSADQQVSQRQRYAMRQLQLVAQQAGARFLRMDQARYSKVSDQRCLEDPHHLDPPAARIFSRKLGELIRSAYGDVALRHHAVD